MNVDDFFASIQLPEKWRVLEKWDEYMDMVRRIEDDPANQDGADKSWVERADREFREHYQKVKRVR